MSLILIYRDTLVADQRCVVQYPHADGHAYNAKKLQLAGSKTFAFATAGPTLSTKEKNILEAIIQESFKRAKGEAEHVALTHPDWFTTREDISLLLMTRYATYYGYFPTSRTCDAMTYKPKVSNELSNYLIKIESDIPVAYGSGTHGACMAVLENVKMEDLMPIVADVVYTVSSEFDIVYRSDLKEMVFV